MSRMKTFFKYFLAIVIVYVLVDVASYLVMKSTYIDRQYTIISSVPEITVTDARTTAVNGYVYGKIKNTTDSTINDKYLKIDCYTKNGVDVGTKYIEIQNLLPGEEMDFQTKFNYDKVDNFIISSIDKSEIKDSNPEDFKIDDFKLDKINWPIVLCALILMYG